MSPTSKIIFHLGFSGHGALPQLIKDNEIFDLPICLIGYCIDVLQ